MNLKSFSDIMDSETYNIDNKKIFDNFDKLSKSGHYEEFSKILLEAEHNNSKIAPYMLGSLYSGRDTNVLGCKDIDKSLYYYLKSFTEIGNIDAGLELAILYNDIAIENKDNVFFKKSIKVYEKIATVNNHIALNMLGEYYEQGLGVDKNIDKALEYYQQAVKAGNLVAAVAVGRIHCLHKDLLTGLKMCLKAKFKLLYKTFKNPNSESLRRQ